MKYIVTFIIVFIVIVMSYTLPLFGKELPIASLKLNRNFLKDRAIQDKILSNIRGVIREYFPMADAIDFTNIKVAEYSLRTDIIVEFYIVNKKQDGWNGTINKMQISGSVLPNDEFVLDYITDQSHCIDVGAIIPENSDKYLSGMYNNRVRDYDNHIKNWDTYKRDWDVNWSNIPIYRQNVYSPPEMLVK